VNPAHLFLGTNSDNQRDSVSKGRSADKRGEKNAQARLTEEAVRSIRAQAATGARGVQRRLAREYGVSATKISHVVLRKAWAHVT
jgi:hypothetical protein